MFKKLCFAITMCLLLMLPLMAQEAVIYGVLFYSPGCRHCHEVLTQHFPKLQAEFGDQLQVLFINVDTREGVAMYHAARVALQTEATGVPMLIIDRHILVGSVNIPELAPAIIRAGLETGGLALPPIPGIEALFAQAVAQTVTHTQNNENALTVPAETTPLLTRLAADPVANALAIGILVALVISLGMNLWGVWQTTHQHALAPIFSMAAHTNIVLLLAIVGIILTLLLAAGTYQDRAILLLALGIAAVFVMVIIILVRTPHQQTMPNWLVPLVTLAGLGVAAYLAYIEVTLTDAICGVVGNCNIVQQSPYARLWNIPIGVIGVVGYLAILGGWFISRNQLWGNNLLLGLTFLGATFSAYLTFLEPFVIGASCLWCLTSALFMLILLWLSQAHYLAQYLPKAQC